MNREQCQIIAMTIVMFRAQAWRLRTDKELVREAKKKVTTT